MKINKETQSKNLNQSLIKGLAIMESFSLERPSWGIRELGRELDMNPATVSRLVRTLVENGFLEQNKTNKRVQLGPKVIKFSVIYSSQNTLSGIARKIFENYSDRFEYNFFLGQLYKGEVVYTAVLDGRGPLRIISEPGSQAEIHTTALGKLLLAFCEDLDYVRNIIYSQPLVKYTENTITNPDVLFHQLEEIRKQGYAINYGELHTELGAIGVPVRLYNNDKVDACVSLGYPLELANEAKIKQYIALAQDIAKDITNQYKGTTT